MSKETIFFTKPDCVMRQKEDKKLRRNDEAFKGDYSTEGNPKTNSW